MISKVLLFLEYSSINIQPRFVSICVFVRVCVCVLVSLIFLAEDLFIASSSVISGQDVGQSFIPLITYVKPALTQSLHSLSAYVLCLLKKLAVKESYGCFMLMFFVQVLHSLAHT